MAATAETAFVEMRLSKTVAVSASAGKDASFFVVPAPLFVAPEVLMHAEAEMAGSSPRAGLLRLAVQTEQTTVRQAARAE